MIREELEGMWHIISKDLKAYYLKPPNVSWGILFPLVLALAFTLRDSTNLYTLSPGLIAMAALFGTTSMEAIVITFEKRVGALERLILAPISLETILLSKIMGGTLFGLMISGVMTLITWVVLQISAAHVFWFILSLVLTAVTLSALGALIAVSVEEVFEAQTLSNYFRFPMIFLCGVFIPVELLPIPLQIVAHTLPLTYSVTILQQSLIGPFDFLSFLLYLFILFIFCIVLIALANRKLRNELL